MIRRLSRRFSHRGRLGRALYKRFGGANGFEWAEHLRATTDLYHLGKDCSILPSTKIIEPEYTWIGDRVCLGSCTLICHDGAAQTINRRHNVSIDRIGPIIIEDDVFVGEDAIILGSTTIGEGSVVGAGSLVRSSVPAGSVVAGNPAKVVAKVEDVVRFWEADTLAMPWRHLIEQREGAFDRNLEPELKRMRQAHFFQGKLKRP